MDLMPMFPILENAQGKNYAQGAFNVTCFPQVKKVLEIHDALRSPALIQAGGVALSYMGQAGDMNQSTLEEKQRGAKKLYSLVQTAGANLSIPVAINADHMKDLETIKMLIKEGFTSVMIDGSNLSFEDNVDLTREVVKFAHPYGVTVEGEIGVLSGMEDDLFSIKSTYTNPVKAVEFLKKTKADCLALSYGTMHGVKKGTDIKLRKEIVIATMENIRHEGIEAVLVSHGSSTVPPYVVEDNKNLGGTIDKAGGIPVEELKEAIKCGISKINIDTDIRLCITRNIREFLYNSSLKDSDPLLKKIWGIMGDKPFEIDFRLFLEPIRQFLLDASLQAEGNIGKIITCMEKGVIESVGSLIVQFGSVGYSNRVSRTSLEKMADIYKAKGI
jgi:fructose-bisphosphate aldolase class II